MSEDQAESRGGSGRFAKGRSGNPKGRPRKDAAAATASLTTAEAFVGKAAEAVAGARMDGWYNATTGYGTSRDKRMGSYFQVCPVTPQEAEELWQGDDLIATIIEKLPEEMLREGFELTITDDDAEEEQAPSKPDPKKGVARAVVVGPEDALAERKPGEAIARAKAKRDAEKKAKRSGGDIVDQVIEKWEELGLVEQLYSATTYERGYGGGAILIGANDGSNNLASPLGDNISEVHYLLALEPRECIPMKWYADPLAPKFGKPETYLLNPQGIGLPSQSPKGSLALVEVHESRLAIFPGIRVSRVARTTSYFGWGDSVLTRALPVVRDFTSAMSSAGVLVTDFAQGVFKVKNLFDMMATAKGLIEERFRTVDAARSTLRSVVVDADGEDFTRVTTPVSGLPELLDRFMLRLAAAAGMPVTLLMGQSPKGLGNEGESDIRFFYDRVAAMQRRKLAPVIRYITKIIMRSLKVDPDKWSIKFRPLWQPTEKEKAEARQLQKDIDVGYIEHGVLTDREVRAARFGGSEYSFETHVDLDEDDTLMSPEMPDDIRDPDGAIVPGEEGDPDAPKPVAAPEGGGAKAIAASGTPVQSVAMNGAQVTSMIEVVRAFFAKEIPKAAAVTILTVGFPVSREQAEAMLPEGFESAKPEPPPSPFGGGGGAPPFGKKPGGDEGDEKKEGAPPFGKKPDAPAAKPTDETVKEK